ncbi:MAG: phosphate signaling complex protein PhoU [Mycobacterium sp.]|jgi:phosphate transport system protein|nr:phosphate signaling complex protein PhoU [Mycobacterium sp.]MCX6481127.1 phosphate signaling complex protein PhoU [Mycobacterium sp.]
MRSAYGAQLAVLTDQLAEMCQMVGTAMERSTQALLHADLRPAEQVIGEHEKILLASAGVEKTGLALLTQQSPLARDLRAIVGSIQIVADIERMGALALHIAEIARRRHPQSALPQEVTGYFAEMGRIALDLAANAHQVIVSCDLGRARYIRDADDAMDDLHRHLFTVLMDREWRHGTAAAVDVTLLGRYYERFADHAVEISRRIIFQATGHARNEERILAH